MKRTLFNLNVILKRIYPEFSFPELEIEEADKTADEILEVLIQKHHLDRERIFIELWWSGEYHLQIIAIHLLPEIVQIPNRISFNILDETIKILHDPELTGMLAFNFARIIEKDFWGWRDYLQSITTHRNPLVHCLVVQTLVHLARKNPIDIPYYLIILRDMMHSRNKIVQNCVSWSLIHLTYQWPESLQSFIKSFAYTKNRNTIEIICASAVGLGPWIIPVLREWQEISDIEIRSKITNTLASVTQIEY